MNDDLSSLRPTITNNPERPRYLEEHKHHISNELKRTATTMGRHHLTFTLSSDEITDFEPAERDIVALMAWLLERNSLHGAHHQVDIQITHNTSARFDNSPF